MRKTIFVNEEYYHIYNRGVDKRKVFMDKEDYLRFLRAMELLNDKDTGLMRFQRNVQKNPFKIGSSGVRKLNFKKNAEPLVEIVVYCLNPNHYHFILKQREENGIVKFMQKLGTSYTMYFNKKRDRSGALFQGRFKSIRIDSNEYLLYLSVYVNKNHFIHGYEGNDWMYSSELDYLGKRDDNLCKKDIILEQFRDKKDHKEFMDRTAAHLRGKKEIQKYLLE